MIVFKVNGREALPLRAIPAATNHFFSVPEIMRLLIDTESYFPTRLPDHYDNEVRLTMAQRILPTGEIKKMLPAEHDSWIAMAGDNTTSISNLPADLFFWVDEFKSFYDGITTEIDATRPIWAQDPPLGVRAG